MKQVVFGLSLAIAAVLPSFAAVDPSAPISSLDTVVSNCALVASTQVRDSSPNEGDCINSTTAFLTTLDSQSLSDAAFDQQIADLVLELIPLARDDEGCDAFDDEVARAIRLAATYAKTDEQRAQLITLSETVAACDYGDTADIPDGTIVSPTG